MTIRLRSVICNDFEKDRLQLLQEALCKLRPHGLADHCSEVVELILLQTKV